MQNYLKTQTLGLCSDTSPSLILVKKMRGKNEENTFSMFGRTRFARLKKKITGSFIYLFLSPTTISCPAKSASNVQGSSQAGDRGDSCNSYRREWTCLSQIGNQLRPRDTLLPPMHIF